MKNLILKQKRAALFVLLITLIGITNTFAQENNGSANQNKRLTYGGEFKMKGFDYDGTKSVTAKAVYEYYNAPDDTRIFDGMFWFVSPGTINWTAYEHNQDLLAENITFEDIKKIYDEFESEGFYVALGRFSQDKQVGKWIWIDKFWNSYSINVCVINFNENGVPEGEFEIYHLYDSNDEGLQYNVPDYYKRSYISGTIVDRVIVSIDYKAGYNTQICCNGVTNYIRQVSGRYNKDGYPIGQWSFSGSDYTDYGKDIVVAFDDEGKCIKNYRTDQTTGDKIRLSGNMPATPMRIANWAINYISHRFFRSTSPTNVKQWPQLSNERYEHYPF